MGNKIIGNDTMKITDWENIKDGLRKTILIFWVVFGVAYAACNIAVRITYLNSYSELSVLDAFYPNFAIPDSMIVKSQSDNSKSTPQQKSTTTNSSSEEPTEVQLSTLGQRLSFIIYYAMLGIVLYMFFSQFWRRKNNIENQIASIVHLENQYPNINIFLDEGAPTNLQEVPDSNAKKYFQSLNTACGSIIMNDSKEIYIEKEEDELYEYSARTEQANNWVLRLGVWGTLYGIMLAFYDASDSIKPYQFNVYDPTIIKELMKGIKVAIQSNAIAVLTSLAAHLITLLLEIFVIGRLKISPSKIWINKTYISLLTNSAVVQKYQSINSDFMNIAQSLEEIKGILDGTLKEIKEKYNIVQQSEGMVKGAKALSEIFTKAEKQKSDLEAVLASLTTLMGNLKTINESITKESSAEVKEIVKQVLEVRVAYKNALESLNASYTISETYSQSMLEGIENTLTLVSELIKKNSLKRG